MLKYIVIVILACSCFSTSWASQQSNIKQNGDTYLYLPKLDGGYYADVMPMFLIPNNELLRFATVSPGSNPLIGTIKSIKPSLHAGIRLAAGYIFPNTANGVELNVTHFSTSDSDNLIAGQGEFLFSIDTPSQVPLVQYKSAHSLQNFKFTQFDLAFDHSVVFGHGITFRYYSGIRYAIIRFHSQEDFGTGTLVGTTIPVSSVITTDDKFNGFGVLAGIETTFNLTKRWQVVSNAGTSLIYGFIKAHSTQNFNTSGSITPVVNLSLLNQHRTFPTLNLSAAVRYWLPMHKARIFVEGGIMTMKYFGVLAQERSDFSLVGPYLRIRLFSD